MFSKLVWILNNFIPNSIPFLHSGFELGKKCPVNTGLNFTQEELEYYKNKKLPLFYKSSFNWLNKDNIINFIKIISKIRNDNKDLIVNRDPESLIILKTHNKNVIAFERISAKNPQKSLVIIINANIESFESVEIQLNFDKNEVKDKISGKNIPLDNRNLNLTLLPGEVVII